MTVKKEIQSGFTRPKRMGKRQRFLLEQLSAGSKHIQELTSSYGERDPNLMIQSLRKLIVRGLVERIEPGTYKLKAMPM